MNIDIDKKAKEYIREKSNDDSVNIIVVEAGSGWCVVYEPTVKFGKPSIEEDFQMYEVDGIKVYVLKGLRDKKKVNISLGRFFWLKTLRVEGLTN